MEKLTNTLCFECNGIENLILNQIFVNQEGGIDKGLLIYFKGKGLKSQDKESEFFYRLYNKIDNLSKNKKIYYSPKNTYFSSIDSFKNN